MESSCNVIGFVSGPTQLRNLSHYIENLQIICTPVVVVTLSGNTRWDRQTLRALREVKYEAKVFFVAGKAYLSVLLGINEISQRNFMQVPKPGGKARAGIGLALLRLLVEAGFRPLKFSTLDTLILGNVKDGSFGLAGLLVGPKTSVVVVDDGNGTVEAVKIRTEAGNKTRQRRGFFWLRPAVQWPFPITFFTTYRNLEMPSQDQVIHNSRFANRPERIAVSQNSAWILGSPLVELGLMPLEKYDEEFGSTVDSLRDARLKVYYFPHRREDLALVKTRCSALGVRLVSSDLPVDEFILNICEAPRVLVSYVSAAIDLLILITPLSCRLFFLEEGYCAKPSRNLNVRQSIARYESSTRVANFTSFLPSDFHG